MSLDLGLFKHMKRPSSASDFCSATSHTPMVSQQPSQGFLLPRYLLVLLRQMLAQLIQPRSGSTPIESSLSIARLCQKGWYQSRRHARLLRKKLAAPCRHVFRDSGVTVDMHIPRVSENVRWNGRYDHQSRLEQRG